MLAPVQFPIFIVISFLYLAYPKITALKGAHRYGVNAINFKMVWVLKGTTKGENEVPFSDLDLSAGSGRV